MLQELVKIPNTKPPLTYQVEGPGTLRELKETTPIWSRGEIKSKVVDGLKTKDVEALFENEEEKFLLPETGMDLRRQIDMWIRYSQKELAKGKSLNEIRDELIQKNIEDARSFYQEYIATRLVLKIPVDFGLVNGKVRLVPTNYSETLYLDTIADKETHGFEERDGTVKETVKSIENFLRSAPRNSIAIFTSPPGWSGLTYPDDTEIVYPDTQTYVFVIDSSGSLKAITLRSDMDLAQNEKFIESFDVCGYNFDTALSNKDRIKKLVSAPILLISQDESEVSFDSVIKKVQLVKSSSNAFESTTDKYGKLRKPRSFDEMVNDVSNLGRIDNLPEIAEMILASYEVKAKESDFELSPEYMKQMAMDLGKAILDIFYTEEYKVHTKNLKPEKLRVFIRERLPDLIPDYVRYQKSLEEMQQREGCAGGRCSTSSPGNSGGIIVSGGLISPRVEATRKVESGKVFRISCPTCGKEVSAMVEGNKIYCLDGKHSVTKPESITVS